jgi:hypothetical protein
VSEEALSPRPRSLLSTAEPLPELSPGVSVDGVTLPQQFPLALSPEQSSQILQEAEGFTLRAVHLSDIPQLGSEVETSLHRVLGQFLDRIERAEQPRIFRLVGALGEAVEAEKLGELADRILNAKPSFMEKVVGFFNRKALTKAMSRAFEEVRLLASGKSKKLSDLIADMEQELRQEQSRLSTEIQALEQLKQQYQLKFVEFGMAVALMYTLLERGRAELALAEQAPITDAHVVADLRDRLQALESRTLALEGLLTRLPSDQLVIRQLQNAGISTLQETSTTAAARFASIKMTLLTLHSALVTQGVQRLAQQGADLDQNLMAVRSKLMKDVVEKAASAPGDNRLAQARQLQAIVADSRSMVELVEQARTKNEQSFQQARAVFAQMRQEMVSLGTVIRPDQAVAM